MIEAAPISRSARRRDVRQARRAARREHLQEWIREAVVRAHLLMILPLIHAVVQPIITSAIKDVLAEAVDGYTYRPSGRRPPLHPRDSRTFFREFTEDETSPHFLSKSTPLNFRKRYRMYRDDFKVLYNLIKPYLPDRARNSEYHW